MLSDDALWTIIGTLSTLLLSAATLVWKAAKNAHQIEENKNDIRDLKESMKELGAAIESLGKEVLDKAKEMAVASAERVEGKQADLARRLEAVEHSATDHSRRLGELDVFKGRQEEVNRNTTANLARALGTRRKERIDEGLAD